MIRLLIRCVWALYPPRFRHRFGADMARDLPLAMERRAGFWNLFDAMATLVRAWASEFKRAAGWTAPGTDLRLAVRAVRQSPGYSVVVVTILALALGGNTAVFSVTHAVLLKGLPYGTPERVVSVSPTPLDLVAEGWIVDPTFTAVEQVEAAALYVDGGGANLTSDGDTRRVSLAQVTEDFFRVLGVTAIAGTERIGRGEATVVLSHAFWVQAYGGNADAVGRSLVLNGQTYRIGGVMPAGVAFPSPVDLWLPFPTNYEFYSSAFGPDGLALLRDPADAAAVRTIVEDRERASREGTDRPASPVSVNSLREELTGSVRMPLLVLLAIAALLVLLGCFNLAGVVLSRNAARAPELSMRRALGAGRARLFSLLFIEVSVLAALGGLASMGMAAATTGLLRRMLPDGTPGLDGATLNLPVLGFAVAVTAAAALAVGFLPALQGAFVDDRPQARLTATDDRRSKRLQGCLIVAQVTLAFVLVSGAALLGRSLRNLESVPLGYDLDQVLTFQVRLPEAAYPDAASRGAYLRDLRTGLSGLAGVTTVGATTYLPQQRNAMGAAFRVRLPEQRDEESVIAVWVQVDEEYFRAMGIPVTHGAPFGEPGTHDRGFDRLVINETLARRLFGEVSRAPGATVALISRGTIEARVDAVVGDVRLRDQRSRPTAIMYTAMDRSPSAIIGMAMRARGNPVSLVEGVRSVVSSVDRNVSPFDIGTTAQSAARQIAVEAAVARLSLVFSLSALALAALGLYGLVSQGIVRRRRELGIRLALGALPHRLVRGAMVPPLLLTVIGVIGGLAASMGTTGLLSPLLFDVPARDPSLLAGVVATVLAVAALASFLSGRAALAVHPAESLRSD